jgi:CHAT domain-containing protein
VDQLVISADGPLALIPFEALRVRDAQGDEAEKRAYLVERYAVRYTPSASALALEHGGRSNGAIVAVGNPRFAAAGADASADTPVPLPSTALELETLARLARSGTYAQLEGERASAARVLALPALADASILHFATHGDVNEAEPERSGLWLAPDSGSASPSRIEVADVLRLRLAADLVTLSACQTGLGRVERGEGVIGLQRAFLAAGARSALVSLWSVNDRSTATLMDAFYRRALEGREDRATALARAKRAMLAQPETRSPFYWAPFVLVGDPGGARP